MKALTLRTNQAGILEYDEIKVRFFSEGLLLALYEQSHSIEAGNAILILLAPANEYSIRSLNQYLTLPL